MWLYCRGRVGMRGAILLRGLGVGGAFQAIGYNVYGVWGFFM